MRNIFERGTAPIIESDGRRSVSMENLVEQGPSAAMLPPKTPPRHVLHRALQFGGSVKQVLLQE